MAKKIHRQLAIVVYLLYLPTILATGLLGGFILGKYLEQELNLPWIIFLICVVAGVLGSIIEAVRIVKKVLRMEKDANP